ncbi:hypothetical protein C8R43DRAFT_899014, partial [Mycena crocata]
LALAIIQAGAFISKSGALDSYLKLYSKNKARLLCENPAQSHDDYAQTVYTTWEISFNQLSKPAALLLQLCSFLHYQEISEEIFSSASRYNFPSHGPSKEDLQQPLEFLSHFLEPSGTWDSLRFKQITNEIRAYSLINFDSGKTFSIHPLVITGQRMHSSTKMPYIHNCMYTIMGMAIEETSEPNMQLKLTSFKLVPHVDSGVHRKKLPNPNFMAQYGMIYYQAGRIKDALKLTAAVVEKRTKILGNTHPHTLEAMADLVRRLP